VDPSISENKNVTVPVGSSRVAMGPLRERIMPSAGDGASGKLDRVALSPTAGSEISGTKPLRECPREESNRCFGIAVETARCPDTSVHDVPTHHRSPPVRFRLMRDEMAPPDPLHRVGDHGTFVSP